VVIIGRTGRNFGAGMSGGIAYVLDEQGDFAVRCNTGMVALEALDDDTEISQVRTLLEQHLYYTESSVARRILEDWDNLLKKFVKVMPTDYKRVLAAIQRAEEQGVPVDDAVMDAAHG